MIGAGIFILSGVAAATQSGPAIVLSFIIAAVALTFVALAYAELGASIGGCGGAYGYAYAAFGELAAWVIGWITVFAEGISVAAIANGWSGYLNNALTSVGIGLPQFLTRGPGAGGFINLPAVLVILVLMMALLAGIKQSVKFIWVVVAVKLLAIAIFIGIALFHVDPALWRPFMPYGWFSHTADGKTAGVLAGAAIVCFAYFGFQRVSITAEEAQNPQRDIPVGTLASLAICTAIYIAVAGLLTAIAPYATLNVSSPVAFALLQVGINWGSALVAAGVIVGLTSTMLITYYGWTRTLFAMARDGLLPPFFYSIDSRTRVPVTTTIVCGIAAAALAGLVPLVDLAQLVNACQLTVFAATCGGVIVLRLTRPEMKRPFKAPGGLIMPILGVLSCGALLSFLPLITVLRFLLLLSVGVAIYFGYAAGRMPSTATEA